MEKRKNFLHRFNIVDIVAIALIAIVIIGIGYRFTGKAAANVNSTKKIAYVVEINDVRQFTVDALNKKGDTFAGKTHKKSGTIVDVQARPYIKPSVVLDGTVKDIEVPERFSVRVTIETDGREGEYLYFDSSNTEIYVGGNIEWYSKWVQVDSSQIKSVQPLN